MDEMRTGGTTAGRGGQRRRRAWWQWVIGLGLLGFAAFSAVMRYVPTLRPPAWTGAVEPIPLRLPAELTPVDSIPAAAGELSGCNLLLVTFDTTRADRLACYGNENIDTPNLDRLAREGVLFRDAVAPSPVTLPSHAAMLTGLYPYHHGARVNALTRLDEENHTLAEVLGESGYVTGAFVSAFVLDARFGIAQGFNDYDYEMTRLPEHWNGIAERPANETCELAMTWLRNHSRSPFFLWTHFFDPHFKYEPPAEYAERYEDLPYDGEIAFADSQLGRLLDVLDDLGLTEKTLVVLAGDHGEGLFQHDELTHGSMIYDSTIRVPLIMRCGQRLGGGVYVSSRVSLIDIMPTVLALLGIDAPQEMDGIDLTQPVPAARTIYLETLEGHAEYGWAALLGIQQGTLKYVYAPEPELYDLSRDPYEQTNVHSSRPELAAALRQQLSAFFDNDLERAASFQPTHVLSPEERVRLESLGYTFTKDGATEAAGSRPDPKKMMTLTRRVQAAFRPGSEDWLDDTIAELERIAEDHADLYLVHRELGSAYFTKGNLARAEAEYRRCLELRPNMVLPLCQLAQLKDQQGDFDAAIEYYSQVLELYPDYFPTLMRLGQLLQGRGRLNEAATLLKRAQKINPADESATVDASYALMVAGRRAEATEVLRRALVANAKLTAARNRLARILKEDQRYDEAAKLLREGLKLMPGQLEIAANLATTLMAPATPEPRGLIEAVAIMERVCEQTEHQNPAFVQVLSRAYARAGQLDQAIATAQKARQLALDAGDTRLTTTIREDLDFYEKTKERGLTPGDEPGPDDDDAQGDPKAADDDD